MLIVLDGPAASGKGTLAKKLSEYFNIPRLDTGKLYRAIALIVYQNKTDLNNEKEIISLFNKSNLEDYINNPLISSEKIGSIASGVIARIKVIRDKLIQYQLDFAKNNKDAILEGRGLGSELFPNADFKFFVTASVEMRATRRLQQLQKNHEKKINLEELIQQIKQRDHNDENRKEFPLKFSKDAAIIDTTYESIDQSFNKIIRIIKSKDIKDNICIK